MLLKPTCKPKAGRRPSAQSGQGLVEFALIGTLFFLVLAAIVNGSWFVYVSVTASNAARNATRWAIAENNYVASPPFGQCSSSDSGLLAAAAAQAGPFSSAVAAGGPVTAKEVSLNGTLGCEVTVTLPTGGLMGLLHIGPPTVTGSSTEYVVS
ncbi:MAG: TadE family protein [Candidatus Dormibacteria bacterium]